MSAIDTAKELAALVKKVGDIDLYRKIVDLQGEVVAQSTRIFELEKENVALKGELEQKKNLKHTRGLYGMEGDPVPYCPICYERDGKLIHLGPQKFINDRDGWECHCCFHLFTAPNSTAPFQAEFDNGRFNRSRPRR